MPGTASYPLAFAELLAGAVLLDKGVQAFKGGLSNTSASASTPAASGGSAATPTGSQKQPTTGPAGAELMLTSAEAASAAGIAYSSAVQGSGLLSGFRSDCSGFVSWLMSRAYPGFGDQTTVTIPDNSNIAPGEGQYVTLWNRPLPGQEGHVIIEILNHWFESGGGTNTSPGGGPTSITAAQAMQELAGGGFDPLHPVGM